MDNTVTDPKYTKEVVNNIRKVVSDIFAAEIQSAQEEFVKMSRKNGVPLKQVVKQTREIDLDSKKELDAILESQEQLIELYEKSEEIRNKVNEITPSVPLPSVKNDKILTSIEDKVNFMNELMELADFYVKTYTTESGQKIGMIKGRESIDKMLITRDLISSGNELENEKYDLASDSLHNLLNELKIFQQNNLPKNEIIEEIIPEVPNIVDQIIDDKIENLPEPKRKRNKKNKEEEEDRKDKKKTNDLLQQFMTKFLDWIGFDKKRNWVKDLINWDKNKKKQGELEDENKDDLASKLAGGITDKTKNFANNIFDDIIGVPDYLSNILMNAKSSILHFFTNFLSFGLKSILTYSLRLFLTTPAAFFTLPAVLLMYEPVKKFAIDAVKSIFGENRITNLIENLLNDGTVQAGLMGAGIGFMLGGPIGAIVGFLVGSVGNYVYQHWDEVKKGFGELTKQFSEESFKKRRDETIAAIEKNKKELETLYAKKVELESELSKALQNKDLIRYDALSLELGLTQEKIQLYEQSKANLERSKELETLRASIAKNETVLGNMWLWMDWASFGLLSNILNGWMKFKDYVSEKFTAEKIVEYISEKTEELFDFIMNIPRMILEKSAVGLLSNFLSQEQLDRIIENQENRYKEEKALRKSKRIESKIDAFSSEHLAEGDRIEQRLNYLNTKKIEDDMKKTNPIVVQQSGPQNNTTYNVNNTSSTIASTLSPNDRYYTGGGF